MEDITRDHYYYILLYIIIIYYIVPQAKVVVTHHSEPQSIDGPPSKRKSNDSNRKRFIKSYPTMTMMHARISGDDSQFYIFIIMYSAPKVLDEYHILSFLLDAQFRHLRIYRRELRTKITSFRWLQTIPF